MGVARIRKIIFIIGSGFVIISLAGCSLIHRRTNVDITAGAASLPAYSGPKARISVADFDVKTTKATGEIGSGLREMLIAALINSNRFSVVERKAQAAVMQDEELSADLIITVTISAFEPQASGGRAGVGGGGGAGSGVLGGLLGAAFNKAHMVLDIRIGDASTSEVLAARPVQGQASDVAGVIKGGFLGSLGLAAGLSAYANTPMEKAIRICIIEAVRYISQAIPANYYKD